MMAHFTFSRPTWQDATDLIEAFRNGKLTAIDVVEQKLRSIADQHMRINAATQIFAKEALLAAKKITTQNDYQKKLSGIPISLKESIGLKGEEITAGSIRMQPIKAEKDALVVEKLKEEGAIVIARTNTPEFSFAHETRSPRFGITKNPFLPSRIPGGSSGGESALIASGGSVLGVGTDVGGSIRYPAHCCGLVGFKPSGLAVSKEGVFPPIQKEWMLNEWLAIGAITQTVRDAELVYHIIAEQKPQDTTSLEDAELIIPSNFEVEIRNEAIQQALRKAEQTLTERTKTKRRLSIPNMAQLHWYFGKYMIRGMRIGLENWLKNEKDIGISVFVESLRRLIGEKTVSGGIYTLLLASKFLEPSEKEVEKIDLFFRKNQQNYYEQIGRQGLLLLPTSGDVALKHKEAIRMDLSPFTPKLFTPLIFSNVVNLPSITIPAWKYRDSNTGLPASVMLCALPNSENLLLKAAYELEKVLN